MTIHAHIGHTQLDDKDVDLIVDGLDALLDPKEAMSLGVAEKWDPEYVEKLAAHLTNEMRDMIKEKAK